jgi:alpha-D-xyloside xylohydrolase
MELFWKVSTTVLVLGLSVPVLADCPASTRPFSLSVSNGKQAPVNNSAVLAGTQNTITSPVCASSSGSIASNGGHIRTSRISNNVVGVSIKSTSPFVGARFNTLTAGSLFYGVWEYPFNGSISNGNVKFDLKGLGSSVGINWSNARAPFFISNAGAGYGVYVDTLAMGSFDFNTPGQAQFIFNASSLKYYIITPVVDGDYKSVMREYMALSARIEMPPDSGYGPTFWSDNFEQDFHAGVTNAQENYYDVINHLYYNEIRATSMFADRRRHCPL